MTFRVLLLCALLIAITHAENPAQITVEQRARFWRAQAELLSAQNRAERALNALQSIQAEIAKTCGSAVMLNASGEPACSPMPEKQGGH